MLASAPRGPDLAGGGDDEAPGPGSCRSGSTWRSRVSEATSYSPLHVNGHTEIQMS
jgi:hypothetical protein